MLLSENINFKAQLLDEFQETGSLLNVTSKPWCGHVRQDFFTQEFGNTGEELDQLKDVL